MIQGIGTDVTEQGRMAAAIQRHGQRLAQRVLSPAELARWREFSPHRQIEFLAGRFAAKEAISKALGIGIARLSMPTVTIAQTDSGIELIWGAEHQAQPYANHNWHVSISHSTTVAFAIAIWEVCT